MQGTTDEVKRRHIKNCYQADVNYGTGVAKALGMEDQLASIIAEI